jgi:hypothetical protein
MREFMDCGRGNSAGITLQGSGRGSKFSNQRRAASSRSPSASTLLLLLLLLPASDSSPKLCLVRGVQACDAEGAIIESRSS